MPSASAPGVVAEGATPARLTKDDYRAIFSRAAALFATTAGHRDALERTLAACLPSLGDFGFFDARDGDEVIRIARAHEDDKLEAMLRLTKWERQDRDDMNLCALSTGEPALHANTDDEWYRRVATSPQRLEALRGLAFRSMITVPMRYRNDLIGSLTLFMARPGRRHSAEHLEVAADISGLAAPLVAHAGLLERHEKTQASLEALRERLAEELGAMHRLHAIGSRVIDRGETLEDLLLEILDAALEITGRDRGGIQLVDPDTGNLRLAAQRGFGSAYTTAFDTVTPNDGLPSAEALRTRQRVVVENVADYAPLAGTPQLETMIAAGVRTIQSTPLVSRDGRIVGVFTTQGREPGAPSERELRLLDLLSRAAADLVERSQAEARLKDADRRKDEFLAILAHELRNPLAPIRYAVSINKDPNTTEEQRRRMRRVVERQVEHMGRLLDDLLDVSRIARGTVALKNERLDLATVIGAAVEASRPLVDSKRHALEVRLPPTPVAVNADPVRLTQIVTNLITNAAKYTDPGGEIDLAAKTEGADLVVTVRDTGIGIPVEMKPKLFTLFSQADTALHRTEGGLGIGLALVKGFVALHGGTVEARSEGLNKGSEFVVRMPIVEASSVAPDNGGEDARAHLGGLRVLVADDNEDVGETCATLLQWWGHRPVTASNGADALGILQEIRPDLAILDIGMPRLNGYEVAERVRSFDWGKKIVLVAVTGWGQEEARQRAAAAGFDHHLTKPVDTAQLEAILARTVKGLA